MGAIVIAHQFSVSPAFTTGKLKFKVGDYKAMLKDPRRANPFVKSFGLMQKIGADELG